MTILQLFCNGITKVCYLKEEKSNAKCSKSNAKFIFRIIYEDY